MARWQRYEPSLAVRVVVWPFSIALAMGYIYALRTLYRTAQTLLPPALVGLGVVLCVAMFIRRVLLVALETKRGYYVEEADDPVAHDRAA